MTTGFLREATEQIVAVGEDQYSFTGDVVIHGIETTPGYRDPKSEDTQDPDSDPGIMYRIGEYARIHGVSSKINKLHGPGGGHPEVSFTGTFSAIFDLYCIYSGEEQQRTPENRSDVRSGVDGQ